MKANKIILTGIALSLSIGLVACNKRVKNSIDNLSENSGQTVAQNDYVEKYSRFYGDNFSDLNTYKKYKTPQETIEYYRNNEYPGNEEYISELKNDYIDTKTKIQNFINYIKNNLPTDNKELTDLKNKLIVEGKKTISIIDQRINKLDEIPNKDYDKSKDDFINDVYKVTTLGDQTESQFESLLKQLNELLGVNPSQSK